MDKQIEEYSKKIKNVVIEKEKPKPNEDKIENENIEKKESVVKRESILRRNLESEQEQTNNFKINDNSYRINIRDSGVWDKNKENTVYYEPDLHDFVFKI